MEEIIDPGCACESRKPDALVVLNLVDQVPLCFQAGMPPGARLQQPSTADQIAMSARADHGQLLGLEPGPPPSEATRSHPEYARPGTRRAWHIAINGGVWDAAVISRPGHRSP